MLLQNFLHHLHGLMIKVVIPGDNGNKFVTHKSLQVQVNSLK